MHRDDVALEARSAVLIAALLGACAAGSGAEAPPDATPADAAVGDGAAIDGDAGVDAGASPDARPLPTGPGTYSFQDGVSPSARYRGTADTYIRPNEATSNFGSSTDVLVSGQAGFLDGRDIHGLLRWELEGLPEDARVVRAVVVMTVTETADAIADNEFMAMRVPWDEATATWERASSNRAWQTAGANGDEDRVKRQLGLIDADNEGALAIDLNAEGIAVVQGWIDDPATNHGLLVLGDGNLDNGMRFASREVETATDRPRLVLEIE